MEFKTDIDLKRDGFRPVVFYQDMLRFKGRDTCFRICENISSLLGRKLEHTVLLHKD